MRSRHRSTVRTRSGVALAGASRGYPLTGISARGGLVKTALVLAALNTDGVARVNGVLDPCTARKTLAYVNERLRIALQETKDDIVASKRDDLMIMDDFSMSNEKTIRLRRFGNVLSSANRYDLMLSPSDGPVRDALGQVLSVLHPTFSACLGDGADLFELGALISDQGASPQPLHPDTRHVVGEGPAVLTAFVALQSITKSMGPTFFLPGTHNAEDHAAFNAVGPEALLASHASWLGEIGPGDVTLYDSRVLHRGGANSSPNRRVLFYVSFKAAGAVAGTGTLFECLRGKHTLAECAQWSRSSR